MNMHFTTFFIPLSTPSLSSPFLPPFYLFLPLLYPSLTLPRPSIPLLHPSLSSIPLSPPPLPPSPLSFPTYPFAPRLIQFGSTQGSLSIPVTKGPPSHRDQTSYQFREREVSHVIVRQATVGAITRTHQVHIHQPMEDLSSTHRIKCHPSRSFI